MQCMLQSVKLQYQLAINNQLTAPKFMSTESVKYLHFLSFMRYTELKIHLKMYRKAKEWVNTPYHHQAAVKQVGCDCIGLLVGVWTKLLGNLPVQPPIYSPQWHLHQDESQLIHVLKNTYEFVEVNASSPPLGSVLCFGLKGRPAHHAAIVSGENKFIHSYATPKKVVEVTLDESWKKRLTLILDYPMVENG